MEKKYFVKVAGQELTVRIRQKPASDSFSVEVDSDAGSTTFEGCRRSNDVALVGGRVLRIEQDGPQPNIVLSGERIPISIKDRPNTVAAGLAQLGKSKRSGIRAPLPGQVVAVLVSESSHVEAGEHLLVIEAMKMQNPVIAEHAGTVQKLHVSAGDSVQAGDQLVELSREE